jgi:hypothetical protein
MESGVSSISARHPASDAIILETAVDRFFRVWIDDEH